MGVANYKLYIKIVFFIVNSLIALLPGIFILGLGLIVGVESYAYDTTGTSFLLIVVGLAVLSVAALGYVGAIIENKTAFYVYSGCMTLLAVGNIGAYVFLEQNEEDSWRSSTIAHVNFVVAGVALAIILARHARKQTTQCGVGAAPAPYSRV